MYVTTFYSYKGGVGRSLALLNVAFDLASRGEKVLLVDFDLEAPGLDTVPMLRCTPSKKGLVDYIHQYISSGDVPSVSSYVHKCTTNANAQDWGTIWIMPAGTRTDEYGARLNAIDWQELYKSHQGFLFMENLRKQWEVELQPDYVLIDSRTGHTDVGGICTRQLPDCVVMLFFPNEQNVIGLGGIVEEIRSHSSRRRKDLLFVLSNTPALDDEAGVLERLEDRARELLGYSELAARIHHYDSMSLLDQEIFVVARPKTRLAAEYRRLSTAIAQNNFDDRHGVLAFLHAVRKRSDDWRKKIDEVVRRLNLIASKYADDPEVLFALSSAYESVGDIRTAVEVAKRAKKFGTTGPDQLLQIAFLTGMVDGRDALTDALAEVITSPDAQLHHLHLAVVQLRDIAPLALKELVESPSYSRLKAAEKAAILTALLWEGCEPAATLVADDILSSLAQYEDYNSTVVPLVLFLIGNGRYSEALVLIGKDSAGDEIRSTFNAAMAQWGVTGEPDIALFRRIVQLHQSAPLDAKSMGANYWQCIAISAQVSGEHELLVEACKTADSKVNVSGQEFSAWRYREVPSAVFVSDLAEIVEGQGRTPRFISHQLQLLP